MTVRAETAPVPGESEAGSPATRVVDPQDGLDSIAYGVTTDFANGWVHFAVHIAPGLNIFSVTAQELSEMGDGSAAQARPCGYSTPQKIYFKVRGSS